MYTLRLNFSNWYDKLNLIFKIIIFCVGLNIVSIIYHTTLKTIGVDFWLTIDILIVGTLYYYICDWLYVN